MTRAELLKAYKTRHVLLYTPRGTAKGRIIASPGKFEGEPIFVPYFWDKVLDGRVDDTLDDDEGVTLSIIEVTDEERREFPELGRVTTVHLWEDGQGFVHCETNEP